MKNGDRKRSLLFAGALLRCYYDPSPSRAT